MKSKRFLLTLLLSLTLAEGFCEGESAEPKSLNLGPLFSYEEDPSQGLKEVSLLGPFVSYKKLPEETKKALRPFFTTLETEDLYSLQFLWPIGNYERKPDSTKFRLLPLYNRTYYVHPDGEEDMDYFFFPFFFGGSSDKEGSYHALFPIYGRTKGLLGKDEVFFVLFPLYVEYEESGYRQKNIMYPFVSYSEGAGRRGKRFFPFYGWMQKEGVYKEKFIMWPFYRKRQQDIEEAQPTKRTMAFPLYASEEGERRDYKAVLWPFFSHTHHKVDNYEEWGLPWPFYCRAKGEGKEGMNLWPIYGSMREKNTKTGFLLWPLGRFKHRETARWSKEEAYVLPFYNEVAQASKKGEPVSTHKVKLWPLFDYSLDEEGGESLSVLSLLPFWDEKGFERNYSALWTLYEKRQEPSGASSTNVLWNLYKHEQMPRDDYYEYTPLLTYKRHEGSFHSELSIMKGLITYKNEDGEKSLKLLRVPLPF